MGNFIKYSQQKQDRAIKKGDLLLGVNNKDYGPSEVTGFYAGIDPPVSGYTIYYLDQDNNPRIYVVENDQQLVGLIKNNFPSTGNTTDEILSWAASQGNIMINNKTYENYFVNNLVLNLDASFTSSFPRSGSVWYDTSGNDYNAELINGPSYSADTIVFDGVDDYGSVGPLPQIGDGSFSFEIYFKLNESPVISDDGVFNPDDYVGVDTQGFYVWINNVRRFHYIITTENGSELNNRNVTLELGRYYHIVLTYEKGVSDGAKLYIDGSLVETTDTIGFGNINNTANYLIGRRGTQLDSYFLGANISFIKYYDAALSANTVKQNFIAQKTKEMDDDYLNVLNYALNNNIEVPSGDQILLQNTMVKSLKQYGIWDKMDVFWIFATENREFARINWKSPGNHTIKEINGPIFTPNVGFKGDGTDAYLSTEYAPATQGVNYQLDSAGRYYYLNKWIRGAWLDVAFNNRNSTVWSAGNCCNRINSDYNSTPFDIKVLGFKQVARDNSQYYYVFNNKTQSPQLNTPSTSVFGGFQNIIGNRYNVSESEFSMYGMGGPLINENDDFVDIINDYLNAL